MLVGVRVELALKTVLRFRSVVQYAVISAPSVQGAASRPVGLMSASLAPVLTAPLTGVLLSKLSVPLGAIAYAEM